MGRTFSYLRRWLLLLPLLVGTLYLVRAGHHTDAELIAQARAVVRAYGPQAPHTRYVTLIDYHRSILAPRLAVVDTRCSGRVVLRARVSHAWNSGLLYATRFSNQENSRLSCRGVFLTQERYAGQFGPALRLRGLDAGLNSHVRTRAIVFHPGFSWSAGCFMTAPAVNNRLVTLIRNGSLVSVTR